MLLYIAGFVALDWVSFIHPFGPFGIKPWDPPTALTLALLVRLGLRYWGAVPVAVFLADVLVRGMPVASLPTLMSAPLITAVHVGAAWMLRDGLRIDPGLTRLVDVTRLVGVSLAATSALATAVVVQFMLVGLLAPEDFGAAALRSWVGDFIGILALTPALLVYSNPRTWARLPTEPAALWRLAVDAVAHAGGILFTVWLVFTLGGTVEYKYFYLLFLPIIWVAVGHGLEGASAGILLTQIALIVAIQWVGGGATTIIEFQMLMLALCLTGLFLGAIVSERRAANRALVDNEARLKAVLATAPDAILTMDGSGGIVSVNPAGERMFNALDGELLRRPVSMVLPQLDLAASDDLCEMTGVRLDGSRFPAEVAVRATTGTEPDRFIAVARDVTRRVEAEAWVHQHQLELTHADRVSMVGEMASAIAHEESQPLAAIAAYTRACQLLLQAPDADLTRIRSALDKVAAQARRAGEILDRLREFLRRGEMRIVPTEVTDIVSAVAELARTDTNVNGIGLKLEIADNLPLVVADRVHVEQVLLNLVRNAVDALASAAFEERRITLGAQAWDDRVRFWVRDTGPGVDPAIASRLFQPFITTKGSGMGLGLSISRTIIEAHGGQLRYDPGPGGGAVFSFDLPVATPTASAA